MGSLIHLVFFLLIGLAAGWLAGQITKGKSYGLVNDLIVGVVGAFLGGILFSLLGLSASNLIGSLIAATVGAIVFLYLLRTKGKIYAFSAYVTAKGKQALRLTEPIPSPKPAGDGAPVTAVPPGGMGAPSPQPAATQKPAGPIRLFYSYSHKDEALRDELEEALALLKRQGHIAEWHDRSIVAGQEWADQISEHLESDRIILLLVSSSFLASDYCYGKEMGRALERHEKSEAVVIPVIIRPCDWHGAPFGKLQSLPKDAKAVTSWTNQDEAWTDVAKGIRRAVETVQDGVSVSIRTAPSQSSEIQGGDGLTLLRPRDS